MAHLNPSPWSPERLGELLTSLDLGSVRIREPMSEHTTMRVGGPADVWVEVPDRQRLSRLIRTLRDHKVPWLILGNGSNLLVRDAGIAGAVVSVRKLEALEVIGEETGTVFAECGVQMTRLVRLGVDRGFEHVWFLSGIPGTVGGAVRMNAGTRYGEFQQVLESVGVMTPSGEIRQIPRDALEFAYRHCGLPRDRVVVGATVRLGRGDPEAVRTRHREVMAYRTQTQPLTVPSLGSVFRNPEGGDRVGSAGKLIEECGLKGVRVHGAQISEKHANWIVNVGGARAEDVLTLIRLIRDRVKQEQGVTLEPEVRVVGRRGEGSSTSGGKDL